MSLILRVSYPATDGSMPESVELEWDQPPETDSLMPVLVALVSASAVRREQVAAPINLTGLHFLQRDVRKGEILSLCSDGYVRNSGDKMAPKNGDYVGAVLDSLPAGTPVQMKSGKWQRQETT